MNTTPNMKGKICLVTGATAGIGRAAASALAAQGATVVLAGRNEKKTAETAASIRAETQNEKVSFLLADFSDLSQVQALADAYKRQFSRLDVLVNNAAGYFGKRIETLIGTEMTFLVNHLAPFLLTQELLGILQANSPARVINVASDAHLVGSMDFADLSFRAFYFGFFAYARSKLANILFTYEFDRRYGGDGLCANALHPGNVNTDLWRFSFGRIAPALKRIMQSFWLTPEQGADTIVYLASSPDVEGVRGKYYIKRKAVRSSRKTYDQRTARQLWEISQQMVEKAIQASISTGRMT